jgi:hypothetical protein
MQQFRDILHFETDSQMRIGLGNLIKTTSGEWPIISHLYVQDLRFERTSLYIILYSQYNVANEYITNKTLH